MIELDELQAKLEKSWPSDWAGMIIYQQEIAGHYAYLSGLLPAAEEAVMSKRANFLMEFKDSLKSLKQYEYKDCIESFAMKEIIYLRKIETLLKTASKHLEGIRTAISSEKQLANYPIQVTSSPF